MSVVERYPRYVPDCSECAALAEETAAWQRLEEMVTDTPTPPVPTRCEWCEAPRRVHPSYGLPEWWQDEADRGIAHYFDEDEL